MLDACRCAAVEHVHRRASLARLAADSSPLQGHCPEGLTDHPSKLPTFLQGSISPASAHSEESRLQDANVKGISSRADF